MGKCDAGVIEEAMVSGEPTGVEREELIRRYKTILKDVVERRPSGIRLKIAEAIDRNKSFVSQITNPNYKTPVPERHLEIIFELAHFTPEEKAGFLQYYRLAHPRARARLPAAHGVPNVRTIRIELAHLASPAEDAILDHLVREFARRVGDLMRSKS